MSVLPSWLGALFLVVFCSSNQNISMCLAFEKRLQTYNYKINITDNMNMIFSEIKMCGKVYEKMYYLTIRFQ